MRHKYCEPWFTVNAAKLYVPNLHSDYILTSYIVDYIVTTLLHYLVYLSHAHTHTFQVEFFTAASAKVKAGCDGVLLIVYPDGRASGDGYAVFDTKDDLKAALSCDREHIQGYSRYVELYRSSLKDLKSVSFLFFSYFQYFC